MNRFLCAILLLLPILIEAQNSTAVKWLTESSWETILQKAKEERKNIFVDCYATWCEPCKAMEKEVYTNDSLSLFINERFISLKLQMDTTKADNDTIISQYPLARFIWDEYKVKSLPTYLFFDSNGKLLDRDIGYKSIGNFYVMAKASLNPASQYYSLLENYSSGTADPYTYPSLAKKAQRLGNKELSNRVAQDYLNYLFETGSDAIFSKDVILFINAFPDLLTSSSKTFGLFYDQCKKVDSIVGLKGYSQQVVNYVIYNEEISPRMEDAKKKGKAPSWRSMERVIRSKYVKYYVDYNLLTAKLNWYRANSQWDRYIDYLVQKVEKYGVGNLLPAAYLNDNAYYVFQYSKKKSQLETALGWIDSAIKLSPKPDANKMDTKANILYKMKRTKEAINLEMQASELDPNNKEIQDNLMKMKKGLITWMEY